MFATFDIECLYHLTFIYDFFHLMHRHTVKHRTVSGKYEKWINVKWVKHPQPSTLIWLFEGQWLINTVDTDICCLCEHVDPRPRDVTDRWVKRPSECKRWQASGWKHTKTFELEHFFKSYIPPTMRCHNTLWECLHFDCVLFYLLLQWMFFFLFRMFTAIFLPLLPSKKGVPESVWASLSSLNKGEELCSLMLTAWRTPSGPPQLTLPARLMAEIWLAAGRTLQQTHMCIWWLHKHSWRCLGCGEQEEEGYQVWPLKGVV